VPTHSTAVVMVTIRYHESRRSISQRPLLHLANQTLVMQFKALRRKAIHRR